MLRLHKKHLCAHLSVHSFFHFFSLEKSATAPYILIPKNQRREKLSRNRLEMSKNILIFCSVASMNGRSFKNFEKPAPKPDDTHFLDDPNVSSFFSAGMWMTCGEGMQMIAARGMKISESWQLPAINTSCLRNRCAIAISVNGEEQHGTRRGIVCFYHEGENDVNVYWTSRSCQCFRGEKRRVWRCELKSHSAELSASWSQQLFTNADLRKLHFNRLVERNQKFDTNFHL